MQVKKVSLRLLAALLTFTVGVAMTLLWVVPRFRTADVSDAPKFSETSEKASETSKGEELSLPAGWKQLEIKSTLTLRLPEDMKSAQLIGDSFAYREAYGNQKIYLVISYGPVLPRRNELDRPYDACDAPRPRREELTYRESVIDVNGRKAKLHIDYPPRPEPIAANVCFPLDDRGVQLIVAAFCKDEAALQAARQIFASVRFKDDK